jgi:tetratricopeptide (TPR) repeat protein
MPGLVRAFTAFFSLFGKGRREAQELKSLEAYLHLHPKDDRALLRLADLLHRRHQIDEAVVRYWSVARLLQERNDMQKSIAVLKQIIFLRPEDYVARMCIGHAYEEVKRNREAAEHFAVAGSLYLHRGEKKEALQALQKSVDLDPRQGMAQALMDRIVPQRPAIAPAPAVHEEPPKPVAATPYTLPIARVFPISPPVPHAPIFPVKDPIDLGAAVPAEPHFPRTTPEPILTPEPIATPEPILMLEPIEVAANDDVDGTTVAYDQFEAKTVGYDEFDGRTIADEDMAPARIPLPRMVSVN